ncbi:hypothetical protein [Chitinophaga sp. Cy-1792]|uniref:hypothetical protein n=1 Tax=Chitinophaga sp. Cy-1792 TaxID=2608339 RepID=UPI00141EF33E|nr:hypothetical protein [Chitinophaga sp. Cy-1792]NIG53548.1 hypothetical protein [Chitinophaga sp. Cy-1792]
MNFINTFAPVLKNYKQHKMKKVFVFAIAAGMFFVACNGGKSASTDSTATAPVDTMAAAPVATPADSSAAVDTAAKAPVADSAAVAAPAAK